MTSEGTSETPDSEQYSSRVADYKSDCELLKGIMLRMKTTYKDFPELKGVTSDLKRDLAMLDVDPADAAAASTSTGIMKHSENIQTADCDPNYDDHVKKDDSDKTFKAERQNISINNGSIVDDQLLSALNRLDARSSPKPEVFNANAGVPMTVFFEQFESYCESKFRCGMNGWIHELGSHLTDESLDVYEALRGPTDTYIDIKTKLLKWFEDSKEVRKSQRITTFKSCSIKQGESLFIFGSRLEKLFRSAFPKKDVEKSTTLLNKYLESVPHDFKQQIQTSVALAQVEDTVLPWSKVLRLANIRDNTMLLEMNEQIESKPPVCFNIRSNDFPNKYRGCDESTQVDFLLPSNYVSPKFNRSKVSFSDLRPPSSHTGIAFAKGSSKGTSQSSIRPCYQNASATSHCTFCNKSGHIFSTCRRRLKLCLLCGSAKHLCKDCPKNKNDREPMKSLN